MNICTTEASGRCGRLLRLILGLYLTLAHDLTLAQSPAPYGEDYYRLGQSWADGSPVALAVLPGDLSQADESSYLLQLETLELAGGPYSDALAEPLSSLGHYYRGRGEYTQALALYGRALHVVRVNDGLYSERQIPMVRDLLNVYRLLGDMQALDDRYEYFFRLYGSGQPPFTDLRLRASLEFLRWQREALRLDVDDDGKKRLLELYQLNKQLLESLALSVDVDSAWHRQLLMSQIRNLYLLQAEIDVPDQAFNIRSGNTVQSAQAQMQAQDYTLQRLLNLQRTSASRGRALLELQIDRAAVTGTAVDLASLHLELGDWHQWNGNFGRAEAQYAKTATLLHDAEELQLLDLWLGGPVELPANGAFWQPDRLAQDGKRILLAATYDISARGQARNIQVTAISPKDEAFRSRLRRRLSATRFRPRFANGEAEAVKGVTHQYELLVD